MSVPITRNMQDAQIVIQDNGSNLAVLDCDEGTFSWEEGADPRVIKHRGKLSHLRTPDEEVVKGSLSVKVAKVRADDSTQGGSDTVPTVRDCFRKQGPAAAWASTGATGEPHQLKIILKIANPDPAGRREVITFGKVPNPKWSFKEGEENDLLEGSFIDNETAPTITHEAQ